VWAKNRQGGVGREPDRKVLVIYILTPSERPRVIEKEEKNKKDEESSGRDRGR